MSFNPKRRYQDESSESDEEYPPPGKKSRNYYEKTKFQSAVDWISKLEVNSYFKQALLLQFAEKYENEAEEGNVVPDLDDDDIAVLAQDIAQQYNIQEQSSSLVGSLKRLPKSVPTLYYRDGSLVGIPGVKRINGFRGSDQKLEKGSQAKRTNGQSTLISNPSLDIDLLLDSSESIDSYPCYRKLPSSAFSRQVVSPIAVLSDDIGVALCRGSANVASPCSSTSSKSLSKLSADDEKPDYNRFSPVETKFLSP